MWYFLKRKKSSLTGPYRLPTVLKQRQVLPVLVREAEERHVAQVLGIAPPPVSLFLDVAVPLLVRSLLVNLSALQHDVRAVSALATLTVVVLWVVIRARPSVMKTPPLSVGFMRRLRTNSMLCHVSFLL